MGAGVAAGEGELSDDGEEPEHPPASAEAVTVTTAATVVAVALPRTGADPERPRALGGVDLITQTPCHPGAP
ncbi:hypothetical protein SAMN05421678_101431 [Actinopolymorpha cephalotaxi]|uniref:Uncharacterized protein n=1 Tax=Actinopolymorpha cephalotaxi TaxID=504797 RepID=A0A1I2KUM7_9ACTN|nr:hypothetical protein [Actinopolymorpha cephalotaxi]NYH84574.1 hypothetical protein [Actinopolymorpha cephalotaxi]SFF68751.1 hypothetical protein SAMN05421678_101431 [Actinopolymorpha cephalotaxi]